MTTIIIITIIGIVLFYSNWSQPEKRISGSYKALNFFSEQMAYPYNSIPDVSHYTAYEKVREKRNAPKEYALNTSPWETIGPHNTAGRTLVIAFNPQNPNTIYTGSASGGLWCSKSVGVGVATWEYVPTDFPLLAVCSIDFTPGDSNIIYLGTGAAYRSTRGSYGIGILKSTDGGKTRYTGFDGIYVKKKADDGNLQ